MYELDVDRLSPAELRSLDAGQQASALNDIYGELKRLANVKCMAIDALANVKMQTVKDPSADNKAKVIDAKRKFDIVGVALSTRKEQIKILQTLLRALPQ